MSTPELWVCQACGREGASRDELRARDSSCGTWAVRVDPATVKRGPTGRIVAAMALALVLLAACGACGGEDTAEPEPTAWPALTARDGTATLTVDYVCDGHGGTAHVTIRTATEQVTRPTPYTCGDWSSLTVFDVPCGTEVVGWVVVPGEAPVYAEPITVGCAP